MNKIMKMALFAFASITLSCLVLFLLMGIFAPSRNSKTTAQDRFADVVGSRMRYRIYDRPGPALILLHGFGGDLSTWDRFVDTVPCGKVYVLDLLGFGLSESPPIRFDLFNQTRYVIEFMNVMGIQKVYLAGVSMGASIALWASAHYPDRVAGAIAISPSGLPGSMRHRWPGNLIFRPNMINKAFRIFASSILFRKVFPNSLAQQALDSTASYDGSFILALKTVTQPVIIVWSRGDSRVPFETSTEYRRILPQAEFFEAPEGAGHSSHQRLTPELVGALCRFLERQGNVKDDRGA